MYLVVTESQLMLLVERYGEEIRNMCYISKPIMIAEREYIETEYLDFEKEYEHIPKKRTRLKSQVYCKKPKNNPIQGRNY